LSIAEVPSRRASTFGNAVNSEPLAYPGNVTAGNLLVCGGLSFSGPPGPASIAVTDTRGTSYSVLSVAVGTAERAWIAYGIAPGSGANTVTVNPSTASDYLSFSIDEFSGVNQITPLGSSGGDASGTSASPQRVITTGTAGELIIGCMGYDGATTTIAPVSPWIQIGEHEDNSSDEAHALLFGIVGAAGAYTPEWVLGASKAWQAMAASFKAAGPTYTLTAAVAADTLTGNAAGLKAGRSLAHAVGSFIHTGGSAGLVTHRSLGVASGSYAFTGNAIGLAPATNLVPGTFAFTGNAAGLIAHRTTGVAQGAYAFTGNAVGLSVTAAAAQPVMLIVT
jgi:hypothetical protein